MLLTLDEGYLLMAPLPDLECGEAPLGPPAPAQPLLLVGEFVPQGVSNSDNSHKGNHLNMRPDITQPPVSPCTGHFI